MCRDFALHSVPQPWIKTPTQFSPHQPSHKWRKEPVIFITAFIFFAGIATWFRDGTTGWAVRGSNSCRGNKPFRSPKRQTPFCDSHSLLINRYLGSLSGVKRPEPYVATNLRLAPKFEMGGAIPLLPIHSFMRWRGKTSFFIFTGLMIIHSVDQQLVCLTVYMRIHVTWFLSSYIVRGTRVHFRPKFQTVQTSTMLYRVFHDFRA